MRLSSIKTQTNSRTGAGIMSQRKFPKQPGEPEHNARRDDEMQHQRKRLTERFDEQARRDVRNDHHRNHPTKNQPEKPRENDVRITRDIEKVEIAIHQSLRANDPKAHRGQAEHDGVMDSNAETKRHNIEQNRKCVRYDAQLGQRDTNHGGTEQGVDNAVEPEL